MDEELLKLVREKYERYQRYRAAVSVAERELNQAVDRLLAGGATETEIREAITGYGDVRPRLSRVPRPDPEPASPRRPPADSGPPRGRQPPPRRFRAGERGWWDDSK